MIGWSNRSQGPNGDEDTAMPTLCLHMVGLYLPHKPPFRPCLLAA
jgi:hypothetical protein